MSAIVKHTEPKSSNPYTIGVLCQKTHSSASQHLTPQISASLLAISGAQDLSQGIISAIRAGVERIHVDVVACDVTPSVSIDNTNTIEGTTPFTARRLFLIKKALRDAGYQTPIDIHLIRVNPSEELLVSYLDAGADSIAIHWECLGPPTLLNRLRFIRSYSPRAFSVLAIGPDDDINAVGNFLIDSPGVVDAISLCAGTLGLSGQAFQPCVLGHLKRLRSRYGFKGIVQMDGGIEATRSAPMSCEAGADILVVGTALFGRSEDYNEKHLRSAYLSLKGIAKKEQKKRVSFNGRDKSHRVFPPITMECLNCKEKQQASMVLDSCPYCGGKLEFVAEEHVDFTRLITERSDLWRYNKLMPVPVSQIVSSGEGYTPVVLLDDLSEQLGLSLYVKLESENPTGTFKDREASFVISRYNKIGQDNFVMQSTGNTGISISYYAGIAGKNSYFFGPICSAYKLIGPPKTKANKVILIKGHPIDVKNYAMRFAKAHRFPKISPFHERSEANATQAYEIGEAILCGKIPNIDFYVQTIAAGMGPIGFYKGMKRLRHWTGDQVTLPRIVAVQISEFAPAQKAWEQNLDKLDLTAQTPRYSVERPFEPTLHTTNAPAYYPYLRQTMKDSHGILVAVEPETVRSREKELRVSLARYGHILTNTEWSSFVGYAGLVELVRNGDIPRGSTVLLMITGKGRKTCFELITPDAIIRPNYDPNLLLKQLQDNEPVLQTSTWIKQMTQIPHTRLGFEHSQW